MKKILLGIVIGVAVSGPVFLLFDPTAEETALMSRHATDAGSGPGNSEVSDVAGSSIENGRPNAEPAARAEPGSTTGVSNGNARTDRFTSAADNIALPEDDATREARLRRQVEQAQGVLRQASGELEQLAISRMLEANPVLSPSPLPPEFGWVTDETYRGVFHERFQREPIDGAWSGPMETELLRFVYDQPGVVEQYGPPTIRCHTRRCEVLFTAAGESLEPHADVRTLFETSLEVMPDTFNCGPTDCWASANHQGGVATMFWAMVVKRGDEPQSIVARASE